MPTTPAIEPIAIDRETEEILADPEVRASFEALDDPEATWFVGEQHFLRHLV
ncbi:MAG: hypothetical protein V2B18_22210 [Pseudomonadota bacterium]